MSDTKVFDRPVFEAIAGIYKLTFPNGIQMRLDRLAEDSRGTVSAEITVTCDLPGVLPHLHQARLNLTSTSARTTLAKHLATRIKDESIDWDAMIEQACVMSLRHHREGEPVIMVGSMPSSGRSKFLLDPLLVRDQPNLIYGPGGVGKSYLACLIAMCVMSGISKAELYPESGQVLYLDYETSAEEIDTRIQSLRHMFPGFDGDIHYRFCAQPLHIEIDQILRLSIGLNASLVIVDSVGSACGGEPESAAVVLAYFQALRQLRCTTLSLDHVAKNAEQKTPFGSVYKYNTARNIFEIKKAQEVGEDTLHIGLYHRKANMGRLIKPLGLTLAFNDSKATFTQADLRDVPELAAGMPLRDQIRELLRSGACTVADIANELNCSESSIRGTLNRYKEMFVRTPTGWGLLTSATE